MLQYPLIIGWLQNSLFIMTGKKVCELRNELFVRCRHRGFHLGNTKGGTGVTNLFSFSAGKVRALLPDQFKMPTAPAQDAAEGEQGSDGKPDTVVS